jgi:uncharacterized membrane protein
MTHRPNWSFKHFFVVISVVFGSIYVVLIPPFQSPDEPNHFLRAWQISEGHFWPERTTDARLGAYFPPELQVFIDSFSYLKNDYSARISVQKIRNHPFFEREPQGRVFQDFANTAVYAPMAYLPQATAMAILRPLGINPLHLLYGARWANLMVWIVLVYAALQLLGPSGGVLCIVALLPASLVVSASCNPDVWVNGLIFWVLAAFWAQKEKIGNGVALLLVGVQKLITIPFLLLYWFSGPKSSLRWFWAVVILSGSLAWGLYAQNLFIPYDQYHPHFRDSQTLNEGVDPGAQVRYILEHPVRFSLLAGHSFIEGIPSICAHMTGKFGWEKNYIGSVWMVLLWLAMLGLALTSPLQWSKRQRGIALVISMLYVGLFSVTMYALWHSVGSSTLGNLQGRYFVPILPLLLLAFGGWPMPVYSEKKAWLFAAVILILSQIAMLFAIFQRYWILS